MAPVRPALDVLVERDSEMSQLRALAESATGGIGAMAVLHGAAGMGKTALVRRLCASAPDGTAVLSAAASELERDVPFGVFCRLLDRHLMALTPDERDRVCVGPAAASAALVLGQSGSDEVPPATMRVSFYWLLDALVAHQTALMVIDDAQWADPESLALISLLASRLTDLPVALVIAVRDVSGVRRCAELAAVMAEPDALHLRLEALSETGVAGMYGSAADPALVRATHALTGGNPFLVTEVVRLMASGAWGPADLVEHPPATVTDAVVRRLAPLPSGDHLLAQALAVVESASLHSVAEVAQLPLPAAVEGIDRLRDAGLVAAGRPVSFRHALLRTAVLAAAEPAAVESTRRRAARVLHQGPRGLDLAAAQLMASEGVGDPWAVQVLHDAATAALAAGSPVSAVALLRRAVAEPPTPERRAATLEALGMAEFRAADPACVTTLTEAAASSGDPATRARCALALAAAYGYAGFHGAAADVLEAASDALAGLADSAGSAGLPGSDLWLEIEAGLVAASLLVPERIAAARARLQGWRSVTGRTRGERLLLIQLAACASGTNQPAAVIAGLARSAIGSWDSPEQHPESTEWVWARLMLAAVGEYEEVLGLADQAEAAVAESGSVLGAVTIGFIRGMARWWSGDLIGAEACFVAMLDHGEVVDGGMLVRTLAIGGLAQCLVEQGRAEEALARLDELPEEFDVSAPANGVVQVLRARAMARHAAGDHEGAVVAAFDCGRRLRALDVDSPTWASWRSVAIEPLIALGRRAEAEQLAAEEVTLAERSGVPRIRGLALRLAALAAPRPDLDGLRRAVDVLDGAGALLEEAKAYVALGAALRRSGERLAAREWLAQGRSRAVRCGAGRLAQEATAELAAAGARPRRVDVVGVGALTAAELRVCELAATGLRNREIAQRLFVAPKTVEVHLSRAYRKLGSVRRSDLAALLATFAAR